MTAYDAGHFDGCLGLEPQSMDDTYLLGYFEGATLTDRYH